MPVPAPRGFRLRCIRCGHSFVGGGSVRRSYFGRSRESELLSACNPLVNRSRFDSAKPLTASGMEPRSFVRANSSQGH